MACSCSCYEIVSAPSVLVVLVSCTDEGDPELSLNFLLHEGDSLLTKLSRVFTDDLTVTEVEPCLVLGDFFLRGGALGNDVCPLMKGTDREAECPLVEGTGCESAYEGR